MKIYLLIIGCICTITSSAQFHPPAGQAGTSAIHKDSTIITAWASSCTVVRGYQNTDNTSAGYTTSGTDSSAIGIADGINAVSLGDAGYAILTFPTGIYDGVGYDFCVFENSFSDTFLELAFVEVSSDGINYFRFPATSNTQDTLQTGSFGLTDATLINNLAGKYRALYGTPFDLQELSGTPGLDISNITHVKIIDVIGNIEGAYATYDQNNNAINDPWPTEFPSGGFDLDAVGVMHLIPQQVLNLNHPVFQVYPIPCVDFLSITGNNFSDYSVQITKMDGKLVATEAFVNSTTTKINTVNLTAGMYVLRITSDSATQTFKFYKQ